MVKNKKVKSDGFLDTKMPEGIIVMSVILFSLSLLMFFNSASSFFYSDVYGIVPLSERQAQGIQSSPSEVFGIGAFYLFFSAFFYLIARGLLMFDNRARIVLICTMALIFGMVVYASFKQAILLKTTILFFIILFGSITWYLTKKDIAKLFKK